MHDTTAVIAKATAPIMVGTNKKVDKKKKPKGNKGKAKGNKGKPKGNKGKAAKKFNSESKMAKIRVEKEAINPANKDNKEIKTRKQAKKTEELTDAKDDTKGSSGSSSQKGIGDNPDDEIIIVCPGGQFLFGDKN